MLWGVVVLGESAVAWLVSEADPAVARLARRDLLGERLDGGQNGSSPVVSALLTGVTSDAVLSRPYAKWQGAHWRLVSLVELGVGPDTPEAVEAAERVLGSWSQPRRLAAVPVLDGRARRCASQEGNAVAVACRLGLADDRRVRELAEHLVAWQWPDGGWNCDRRTQASRSSVNETLPALWGLHEYQLATGDSGFADAVHAASEVLLRREVVFAQGGDELIHPSCGDLHYPPYWHYDVLQALLILHRVGRGSDPRTARARQLIARRRRSDGRWRATRRWWRPPGSRSGNVEAVDWLDVAHQMITLNAYRVGAHHPAVSTSIAWPAVDGSGAGHEEVIGRRRGGG
jgi:hypothetical protein